MSFYDQDQEENWAGWPNEGTYAVAWYYGQEENYPFAMEQAARHELRPHTLGTALVAAAEMARLIDTDRTDSAFMQFTGSDGRNLLNEVDYEEVGAGFLAHLIEEGEMQ